MKNIIRKLLPYVSSAAFAAAFFTIGTTCRTFLYQPKIPAKLKEIE